MKPIITSKKCKPIKPYSEPYDEIQLECRGPIYNERSQKTYLLAFKDRFYKFPSAKVSKHANAISLQKFLPNFILLHGVPRRIYFDQARCQVDKQKKQFLREA